MCLLYYLGTHVQLFERRRDHGLNMMSNVDDEMCRNRIVSLLLQYVVKL